MTLLLILLYRWLGDVNRLTLLNLLHMWLLLKLLLLLILNLLLYWLLLLNKMLLIIIRRIIHI